MSDTNQKNQKEQEFKEKVKEVLPKYISVGGIGYTLIAEQAGHDESYRFIYVEYNGSTVNWDNKLIDLWYAVCDVIPEKKEYKEGELHDCSNYVTSMDAAIQGFLTEINKLDYEKLDEIITKSEMFQRELSGLLNKYGKERGSNTQDFILAGYLSQCLRAFNHAVRMRDELRSPILDEFTDGKIVHLKK